MRKAAALLALGDRCGARGAARRAAALDPEDTALLRLQAELQTELQTGLQTGLQMGLPTGPQEDASPPSPRQHWGARRAPAAAAAAAAAAVPSAAAVPASAMPGASPAVPAPIVPAPVVPASEAAVWGASFAKGRASRRLAAPAPVASPCEGGLRLGLGSALCSALSAPHWSRQLIAPLAMYGVLLCLGWLRL